MIEYIRHINIVFKFCYINIGGYIILIDVYEINSIFKIKVQRWNLYLGQEVSNTYHIFFIKHDQKV